METKNLMLHSKPKGPDWVHIDDFVREVNDVQLINVFVANLEVPGTASQPLRGYAEHKLVEVARVIGGRGYYVRVKGYDKAVAAGPLEVRELIANIDQKWRALEMLASMDEERPMERSVYSGGLDHFADEPDGT